MTIQGLTDVLLCSSVCLLMWVSVEAAVAAFAQARAPGIYKGDYLKELFRRYGDVEDAPAAPVLPEWCFDDDDGDQDDDGNVIGQESQSGPSSSESAPGKRRKERLKFVRLRLTEKREGTGEMGCFQIERQCP